MIGVDIDGVLADSDPVFRKHLQKLFKRPFKREDVICFDYQKCFGLTNEQMQHFWETFCTQTKWLEIKLLPGAKEVLQHFKKEEIVLITARPQEVKKDTLAWLEMNRISYARLIFMQGNGKHEDVLNHGLEFDYFIEDRFEFSKDLADMGIKVLLLNYPWNIKFGEYKNIARVNNWSEIANIILKKIA